MEIKRRTFIKNLGLAATSILVAQSRAFSVPYAFPGHNIPVEKNLDPAWVKSLYQRGNATTYLKTRNELAYIGMPAGGLHAGTVYLGGDGRLWLWGIFNDEREGVDPKIAHYNDGIADRDVVSRNGANYVEPTIAANKRVLEQGFAIRLKYQGKTVIKELKEEDWEQVSFRATYPLAVVTYTDSKCPVEVTLTAGSPFIPMDPENSSFPATVFDIEIKNKTAAPLDVAVLGWLENGSNKVSAKTGDGLRKNSKVQSSAHTGVSGVFETQKEELKNSTDFGSMSIALARPGGKVNTSLPLWPLTEAGFDQTVEADNQLDPAEKLVGSVAFAEKAAAGKFVNARYVIAWHFNNPGKKLKKLVTDAKDGYYYGKRFKDAGEVAAYVSEHFESLFSRTKLWQQTWDNATLPHWFMERTFVNISTLATANTWRFADGRFWSWEGVGACEGTCTHVWQYAQAMGRIFPSLERITRQGTDLDRGFNKETGAIGFRGENNKYPAIDGQAGTILRFYREHQTSANNEFLKANWPRMKQAIRFMLAQDQNGDGMTDTPMENTLDAVWEGEIAWIVGLCVAAASAGKEMALEMQDAEFAAICGDYASKGKKNMEEKLFNGEYFIHRPDAVLGRKKLGSYNTCHIDQVYGQSWAFQVGLPRVLDQEKTLSTLKALWKYNFTKDVGPYIKTHIGGRPYALPGDGGMVMNTNPANEPKPYGEDVTWQLGYFHECMSGFEHQVAAHMMAEGMIDESLILTRSIHDRYHGSKRNPYNEIECSDHYARAMASYGTFINACGFRYHGPKGFIAFAPQLSPDNFKAPFTVAEGWGTYAQNTTAKSQVHRFELAEGKLNLEKIELKKQSATPLKTYTATYGQKQVPITVEQVGEKLTCSFKTPLEITAKTPLSITINS